jgi:hypothetical protein
MTKIWPSSPDFVLPQHPSFLEKIAERLEADFISGGNHRTRSKTTHFRAFGSTRRFRRPIPKDASRRNVRAHTPTWTCQAGAQIVEQDGLVFIGHMAPPYGRSIIDVHDPRRPTLLRPDRAFGKATPTRTRWRCPGM